MCRAGERCHICTGCGRCFGGRESVRVVTKSGLEEDWERSDGAGWVIAADVGTTTVAMLLYGKDGTTADSFVAVNPQVKYGADVISRIEAAGRREAAEDMRRMVREVLACGVRKFKKTIDREKAQDEAVKPVMAVAANTVMTYLLLGFDPAELGHAPFHAAHLDSYRFETEGIEGIVLPGISAFAGSDVVAGIYGCGMADRDQNTLLIDLGTNGEMAIGNRKKITVCSAAAGPAFEGGASRGIWGADMVHFAARLLREGILDETGLMADAYFESGVRIGDVLVTQQDIRSLQLAKAAVAAGIEILAERFGLQELGGIDRVVLAGGFGYFLKAEDAAEIGLLPSCLASRAVSGGNTALAGLKRAAFSKGKMGGIEMKELSRIVSLVQTVNLAQQETFQERYLEAMYLRRQNGLTLQ